MEGGPGVCFWYLKAKALSVMITFGGLLTACMCGGSTADVQGTHAMSVWIADVAGGTRLFTGLTHAAPYVCRSVWMALGCQRPGDCNLAGQPVQPSGVNYEEYRRVSTPAISHLAYLIRDSMYLRSE